MNIIRIPGLADYQKTLRMQEELVRAHQDDPEREDELLLLEHASVYTIGRTRDHASLHPGTVLPFPSMKSTGEGRPPTTDQASLWATPSRT